MHLTLLRSGEPKLSGKSGQGIKLNDPWYPDKLESSMWKTACVNAAFELIHVDCRVGTMNFCDSFLISNLFGCATYLAKELLANI